MLKHFLSLPSSISFIVAPAPAAAHLSERFWQIDPEFIEVAMSRAEQLGRGGYADVYRGRLCIPGKTPLMVAVKAMHSEYAANPAHVRKFGNGNAILYSCSHPNICKVFCCNFVTSSLA